MLKKKTPCEVGSLFSVKQLANLKIVFLISLFIQAQLFTGKVMSSMLGSHSCVRISHVLGFPMGSQA